MNKLINNKFMKFLWKFIQIVLGIILFFILIIVVTQRVFNNKFSFLGYQIYTVATGSMVPKYNVHDLILAKKINPDDIKVKDDIVYNVKEGDLIGNTITHQVIEIQEKDGKRYFVTQGIANPLADPLVDEYQVQGKIIYKLVSFSLINKTINTNIGFFLLIVIPIAVLILLEIIDLKEKRESLSIKDE